MRTYIYAFANHCLRAGNERARLPNENKQKLNWNSEENRNRLDVKIPRHISRDFRRPAIPEPVRVLMGFYCAADGRSHAEYEIWRGRGETDNLT